MATSRRTSTSRSTGPSRPSPIIVVVIVALVLAATTIAAKPTVLRIRTADRGVIRVTLPDDDDDDPGATTLSSILSLAGVYFGDDDDGVKCQLSLPGSSATLLDLSPGGPDGDKTAEELGLEHGSIITILPSSSSSLASSTDNESGGSRGRSRSKNNNNNNNDDDERFDPFPHLAKSAPPRARRRSRRSPSRSVNTYGDISRVQDAMHDVEAQSNGPLARVYVCSVGAARFRNHCSRGAVDNTSKKGTSTENHRVALLFGTIDGEAVDPKNNAKRARTSLSSTTREMRRCEVARVHAIWEPPNQKPSLGGMWYDGECLLSTDAVSTEDDVVVDRDEDTSSSRMETPTQRAIRVAGWLGLRPVGWMFSHSHDRNTQHADEDEGGASLPVHGRDAITGATLQIELMKCTSREDGRKFVTLALDCRDGSAEAFQLSDACVQMVAEGVLSMPSPAVVDNGDASRKSTRFITLMDPVLVSGEETKLLDSVLLLVNLAMLSHVGLYSGGAASIGGSVKRSSGALLVKTRKRILAALAQHHGDDGALLKELCDFDVLLALDSLIGREESGELCSMVRKYASGKKKSIVLDDHLRLNLQTVLDV